MSEKRPVVVGIDSGVTSRHAALWAAGEATRHRAPLSLVHAVSVGGYVYAGGYLPPQSFFDGLQAEARRQLRLVRDEVTEAYPHLEIRSWVHEGHPVPALIEQSGRASMVVLGSHRDEPHSAFVPAGSVAVAVAAHGHSPVAVIRRPQPGPGNATGPVVVGIDGSPASEQALAIAFDEATLRRTHVVAVHAWREYTSELEYLYATQFIADWKPIYAQERETLAERLAGWQEKYPDVPITRVVTREPAAVCLVEQAATAQLLVVGSRGRGGFTGLLLGSTSRTLLHTAPCPVIVAKP